MINVEKGIGAITSAAFPAVQEININYYAFQYFLVPFHFILITIIEEVVVNRNRGINEWHASASLCQKIQTRHLLRNG